MPPSVRARKVKSLQSQIQTLRNQLDNLGRGIAPRALSAQAAPIKPLKGRSGRKSKAPVDVHLTDREREVLRLTVEEYVAREIAQKLKIGVRTVESYRASLLEKLDCRSLVGLTRYAILHGIVPL